MLQIGDDVPKSHFPAIVLWPTRAEHCLRSTTVVDESCSVCLRETAESRLAIGSSTETKRALSQINALKWTATGPILAPINRYRAEPDSTLGNGTLRVTSAFLFRVAQACVISRMWRFSYIVQN